MNPLNTPEDDLACHARITGIVTAHMAMHGSMRPTGFVLAEDGEEIVVVDAVDVEDPRLFIDVIRRTSATTRSARSAIASECFRLGSDDPEEMAAIHKAVSEDPGLLETHPLMQRGITVQVESDDGLTTSFHAIERHHPEMAAVMPSEPTFQPVPEDMRGRLNGFHVPSAVREGPEMAEIMRRVGHVEIPKHERTETPMGS